LTTDPAAYRRELEVVTAAVLAAGDLVMEYFESLEKVPDARFDITTEADLAAQELLLEKLIAAFPDDAFLCEEDTPLARTVPAQGPRLWMIDPIDGTRGFARKTDEFSVMAGLVAGGNPVVGIVYQPIPKLLTRARAGGGCEFARGDMNVFTPSRVSGVTKLSEAVVAVSSSNRQLGEEEIARRKGCRKVIFSYSTGIKMAMVARGDADVYVTTNQKLWDIAPGTTLVEEAGGVVLPDPRSLGCWPNRCDTVPSLVIANAALAGSVLNEN